MATGLTVYSTVKGAGSDIADNRGIYVQPQIVGNINYAIYTEAGLVRFGDALSVFAGDVIAAAIHRTLPNGSVLVLNQQDSLQAVLPYLSFQRAGADLFILGTGTDGQVNFFCKGSVPLFAVRDSADVIFFTASKGVGANQAGINIWDFTDGVLKQVSFSADDGGGAGFKYLKVPN
jgi:hypothetical protein